MAAILFHEPIFATIVESGDQLYFYEVGTTTDLTVYTDFALSTEHSQPIVADSDGRFAAIYIDSAGNDPKVVLHDSDDAEKWTLPRYPIEDTATLSTDLDTAEADIDSLEGRMTTAESDIDTLETESADYESRITDLEGGSGGSTIQTFTGNGTYTKPSGLSAARVTVVGGGGGGVTAYFATTGGGGGGAAVKLIAAGDIGSTESVTVGGGGVGKSSAGSPTAGNDGGSASFGSHCSATGGKGAQSGTTNVGEWVAGGVGSDGDYNVNGFPSGPSVTSAASISSHPGGGTMLGGGALTGTPSTPGAGGASRLSASGQDGADGIVIVEEFY